MTNIRVTDMLLLEDIFEMGGGYVLNFSDRTFSTFFSEELGINIDDPVYARGGSSKGKRFRCFIQTVDKATAARTLKALWDYREALRLRADDEEKVPNAERRVISLINRLEGMPDATPSIAHAFQTNTRSGAAR